MDSDFLLYLFMDSHMIAIDENQNTRFSEELNERKNKLLNILDKDQKDLFDDFGFYFVRHMLAIRDNDLNKVMFCCIKIGMELQDYIFNRFEY